MTTTCRCGHSRVYHRPTNNAINKARSRPGSRPPQSGCRWLADRYGYKWCPCRNWTPVTKEAQG